MNAPNPSTVTRPPFAYYGGKTTVATRIVEALPPHEHYVEPFAGSLAVLLAKPQARFETANDLDGDLMLFWRVLRDRPEDLARACELTPHGRGEHAAAYDLDGAPDELERARRVWVLLSQTRTGTLRKTGWRHYQDPAGTSGSMPSYLAGYVGRLPDCARRLAGVSLEARPALEVVEAYGRHRGVLLYVDPPYLGSTRRCRNYRVEMSSEAEHRDLAAALHSVKATVVLSGYASPLYEDLYGDWSRMEISSHTGNGLQGATDRVEVLWGNVELGAPHLFTPEAATA